MIFEPSVIVLYVDNLPISSMFYQDLLTLTPAETSITFHSFKLSNGMSFALKARHSVVPAAEGKSGHGELAFILDNPKKVDELFAQWQTKKIEILSPPSALPFGYTFVATDPDGHRLRVLSLAKA